MLQDTRQPGCTGLLDPGADTIRACSLALLKSLQLSHLMSFLPRLELGVVIQGAQQEWVAGGPVLNLLKNPFSFLAPSRLPTYLVAF